MPPTVADTIVGREYVLTSNYEAAQCDGMGRYDVNKPVLKLLERGFKIFVDNMLIAGGIEYAVISVVRFNDNLRDSTAKKEAQDYNETYFKQGDTYLSFLVPISDLGMYFKPTRKKRIPTLFTLGIPTIPAKLRFGNGATGKNPRYFRFESNLSLGLSLGAKWQVGKEIGLNVIGGFTIASVQVDSVTTNKIINTTTTAASFSPHIGFVIDINKFQVGLYTGMDFLYGQPNKYWVYRNQPWFGIGVGYSLFKIDRDSEAPKRSSNTQPFLR